MPATDWTPRLPLIRRLIADGMKYREIGAIWGEDHRAIQNVVQRHNLRAPEPGGRKPVEPMLSLDPETGKPLKTYPPARARGSIGDGCTAKPRGKRGARE